MEYVAIELFRFVQVDEVGCGNLEGFAAVVAGESAEFLREVVVWDERSTGDAASFQNRLEPAGDGGGDLGALLLQFGLFRHRAALAQLRPVPSSASRRRCRGGVGVWAAGPVTASWAWHSPAVRTAGSSR